MNTADPSTLFQENIAVHDAHELVPNGVQARIVLGDQTYTLRITRAGKLVLTK